MEGGAVDPDEGSSVIGQLEAKNDELYVLEQQLLSGPKKERKDGSPLRQRIAHLDAEITALRGEHKAERKAAEEEAAKKAAEEEEAARTAAAESSSHTDRDVLDVFYQYASSGYIDQSSL